MSGSPGLLYRLACALSLTHIASGVTTILVYDVEDATDSQFIAVLYAAVTFYMVYAVIPHTTQKDNDPVSRLNKQFVIINFLLLCWVLSIGLVPLTVSSGITHTIAYCADAWFLTPRCLTIGLDMALPFALIGTLGAISYSIYRTARALQLRLEIQGLPTYPAPIALPPSPSAIPPSP